MEGISCDSQSKEVLDAHIPEEGQLYTKFMKSKVKMFQLAWGAHICFELPFNFKQYV